MFAGLFLHVPKTGGSSVSTMIRTLPDWKNWYHYRGGQPLFFATVHEVFDSRCIPTHLLGPNATLPDWKAPCSSVPDWRSSKIFLEFHEGAGLHNFFRFILPRLEKLRSLYAAASCPLLLTTVLRDPPDHFRSMFAYFHVYGDRRLKISPRNGSRLLQTDAAVQTDAFGRFLARGSSGPLWVDQSEFLANQRNPSQKACDPAIQAKSEQLLEQMDMVGVYEHLREFMWSVAARLGYWLQPHNGNGSPMSAWLACNAAPYPRLLHNLTPEVETLLEKRSHCSRALYVVAAKRDAEQRREWKRLIYPTLLEARPSQELPALRVPLQCKEWTKLQLDQAVAADTAAMAAAAATESANSHRGSGWDTLDRMLTNHLESRVRLEEPQGLLERQLAAQQRSWGFRVEPVPEHNHTICRCGSETE